MQFLKFKLRQLRQWIEDLDRKDEDYFGYGDDHSVVLRKIARPIKNTVVQMAGWRRLEEHEQGDDLRPVVVNSAQMLTQQLPEQGALPFARAARCFKGTMRSAAWRNGQTFSQVDLTDQNEEIVDNQPGQDYFYLPFALPDEIRIPLVEVPLQAEGSASRVLGELLEQIPRSVGELRMERWNVRTWTGRLAGLGLVAILLLVVRPLVVTFEAPLDSTKATPVTDSGQSTVVEKELAQVREALGQLQDLAVVAPAETGKATSPSLAREAFPGDSTEQYFR